MGKTIEILLYGNVGDDTGINGDAIAEQINRINQSGDVDLIIERINSNGGQVTNGLSVVAANLRSKIEIHTYNDGIAASMAGVILLTGKKIFAADYSQLMLHEPQLFSETIETTKDEKIKNGLTAIRDGLSTIIQNRTGKDKENVDQILRNETWYDAKTAKRQGFIDEVISFAKKPNLKSSITTDELMAEVTAFYKKEVDTQTKIIEFTNINNVDMELKKVENLKMFNAFLGINENAGEVDMFKEVQKIVASNEKLTKEVADKAAEIKTLTDSKDVLKDEVKGYKATAEKDRKDKIDLLLANLPEDEREDWRNIAELDDKGFEYAKKVIEKIKPYESVTKKIDNSLSDKEVEKRKDWTWDNYHKAGLLAEVKENDEELYKELYKAKFGKELK